jgi:hypothetical protein
MNTPAPSHSLPFTALLHENFSIVMMFAFSRPALEKFCADRFAGNWKYLWKACFDLPEERANRALLELALQLRFIDDKEHVSDYFKQTNAHPLGKVIKQDSTEENLYFRDLTNKILHSSGIEWSFLDAANPAIVCQSDEPARWVRAEIQLFHLAGLCGRFMS